MRVAFTSTIACCCIVGLCIAGPSLATAERKPITIPAQELSLALQSLAQQREFQIVCQADLIKDLRTADLSGEFTPYEALAQLLNGTGLTYRLLDADTVTILQNPPSGSASGASSSGDDAANSGKDPLEEIVVTARKQKERLQDVPMAVTALTGASLVAQNQVSLKDYYQTVPGLNLVAGGFSGKSQVSIRGLATSSFENPVVGIVVDDVPLGSSSGIHQGNLAIDLDPGNLDRIEVLRGPQGSLYGAASMGGLIKYVTTDPSTDGFFGRVEAGVSDVAHAEGQGYGARGAVNLPVSEDFALRVSGFYRHEPGWVFNPFRGEKGINEARAYGGRMSGLWKPTEELSIKLAALYQKDEADGGPQTLPPQSGLPTYAQNYAPGLGAFSTRSQVYTSNINYDFGGGVSLMSATGYSDSRLVEDLNSFGPELLLHNLYETKRLSQELRLVVPVTERVTFTQGFFYSHERNSPHQQDLYFIDPDTAEIQSSFLTQTIPGTLREWAPFANLAVQLTDRFDVLVGGRYSEIKIHDVSTTTVGGDLSDFTDSTARSDKFTYLVNPRFKFTPDVMGYARVASGYRAGGPNPAATANGFPRQFEPDTTTSYEVGLKASTPDNTLSADLSVYYIDWSGIQLSIITPENFRYFVNGGKAKSEGVELSAAWRPLSSTRVSGWVAYNNAVLTQDTPEGGPPGHKGDHLPQGAEWSGNFSLDQDMPLNETATAFVGGSVAYIGKRFGAFGEIDSRAVFPSYWKLDLRASVRMQDWTISLYANNVTDSDALLDGNLSGVDYVTRIEPRRIGVSVARTF